VTISIKIQPYEGELYCKVCDRLIYDEADIAETFCEHTLFLATSEGFEFCDDRTKINLNIPIDQNPNALLEDISIDDITNKITIPNSHKIVITGGSASMLEVYYGFVKETN